MIKNKFKEIIAIVFNYLSTQKWYIWCNKNQIKAHLIFSFVLALQVTPLSFKLSFGVSILISFLTSSGMFFLKEYIDTIKPNPTGFDKFDLRADYFGWVIGTWIGLLLYGVIKSLILNN